MAAVRNWTEDAPGATGRAEGRTARSGSIPERRFNMRQRRSPAPTTRPQRRFRLEFAASAVALAGLLVYVLFCTLSMRGSFTTHQLESRIRALHQEQSELIADVRRLQASGLVRRKAWAMGMRPAGISRYGDPDLEGDRASRP